MYQISPEPQRAGYVKCSRDIKKTSLNVVKRDFRVVKFEVFVKRNIGFEPYMWIYIRRMKNNNFSGVFFLLSKNYPTCTKKEMTNRINERVVYILSSVLFLETGVIPKVEQSNEQSERKRLSQQKQISINRIDLNHGRSDEPRVCFQYVVTLCYISNVKAYHCLTSDRIILHVLMRKFEINHISQNYCHVAIKIDGGLKVKPKNQSRFINIQAYSFDK